MSRASDPGTGSVFAEFSAAWPTLWGKNGPLSPVARKRRPEINRTALVSDIASRYSGRVLFCPTDRFEG